MLLIMICGPFAHDRLSGAKSATDRQILHRTDQYQYSPRDRQDVARRNFMNLNPNDLYTVQTHRRHQLVIWRNLGL